MHAEQQAGASWFATGWCADCGYPVVVTQGRENDYRWYCSNPDCGRHRKKEDLADTAWPVWVVRSEPLPLCPRCPHGLSRHCADGSCIPCVEAGIDQGCCGKAAPAMVQSV